MMEVYFEELVLCVYEVFGVEEIVGGVGSDGWDVVVVVLYCYCGL